MPAVMLNQKRGCFHQKDHASSFAARWAVMCVERFFTQLSFDCSSVIDAFEHHHGCAVRFHQE